MSKNKKWIEPLNDTTKTTGLTDKVNEIIKVLNNLTAAPAVKNNDKDESWKAPWSLADDTVKDRPRTRPNDAVLIMGEDWEGIYVNGKLIQEGHTLNKGESRTRYFLKLSFIQDFELDRMREFKLIDCDNLITDVQGNFPKNLIDFIGDYRNG